MHLLQPIMARQFAAEMVTLPHPFLPDVEIRRQMGDSNLTRSAVFANCSTLTKCSVNGSGLGGLPVAEEYTAWVGASEDILYITFPVVVAWGIFSLALTLIILLRQISTSSDSYFIGFTITNILLLTCGGLLKVEDYMGHKNWYQHAYGHIQTINDWLWYTSLWLLVGMVLDRATTINQKDHRPVCSPAKALVLTILVCVVCAVSALPELWLYEVTETFDYLSNTSLVMSQQSSIAKTPAFFHLYFWYTIIITVFFPYPIFVALLVVLIKGMQHSMHSRKRMPTQHGSGNIMNKKVTEEINLTRLFIVMVLLYMLLTGPFTFLTLVDKVNPHWNWPTDTIYPGLYTIFQFTFYFYFSVNFLLLCSYYDKFRYCLYKTFCRCCQKECHFTKLKQEP